MREYRFDDVSANPNEQYPVELDLYPMAVNAWKRNEPIAANEFIRPTIPNGFSYENTGGAGTTGSAEPQRWPTTLGATVTNGSVTFTCRAAGSNAISAISSPTIVSDPSGMTVSSVSVDSDRFILATYSGGTLGQSYDAVISFTMNGLPRVARQRVNWVKQ